MIDIACTGCGHHQTYISSYVNMENCPSALGIAEILRLQEKV
jgi:hypothetical protein